MIKNSASTKAAGAVGQMLGATTWNRVIPLMMVDGHDCMSGVTTSIDVRH